MKITTLLKGIWRSTRDHPVIVGLFILTCIEISALESSWGFKILSSSLASIVGTFSYALAVSCVFHFATTTFPCVQKKAYYEPLITRGKSTLKDSFTILFSSLGRNDQSKGDLHCLEVMKYLNKNGQWIQAIDRLERRTDCVTKQVSRMLCYQEYIPIPISVALFEIQAELSLVSISNFFRLRRRRRNDKPGCLYHCRHLQFRD